MKKIASLLMCLMLLLCSCSNSKNNEETIAIEIPFQKVAACNNRAKLLEKYGCITERTASRESENENFGYWTIYYEKDGENINAILDYSVNYKCLYYNNEIFTQYGDGITRKVLTYREDYNKIMTNLMARTDTLSYVFIIEDSAEIDTDEEGFIARYEFIVNNDILSELEGLGLEAGDRVQVEYDLDKDYIIKRCRYYKIDNEKRSQIARIDVVYGEKKSFPDEVVFANDENKEFVEITVIENFGTGSQYSETFKVEKGGYIVENERLLRYYLFKDPIYQTEFNAMEESIDKNTDIFIIDVEYSEQMRAQQEYMEKQLQEYDNQKKEQM